MKWRKGADTGPDDGAGQDLSIPAAGFDFTGGAYFSGRRQAATSRLLATLSAVLVATPLALGGLAMYETRQLNTQIDETEAATDAAFVELANLTGLSGTTPEAIDAHRAARAQLVAQPLATQLAYARVLADIEAATPAGVTLTSIALSPTSQRGANATIPSVDGASLQVGTLQVSGTATSQAAETQWEDAIAALPYIRSPLTNYSNLGSDTRDLTFSTQAELTAGSVTDLLPVVNQLLAGDLEPDDVTLFSELSAEGSTGTPTAEGAG